MSKQLGLSRARRKALQRSIRHTLPGLGILAGGVTLLLFLVPPVTHPADLTDANRHPPTISSIQTPKTQAKTSTNQPSNSPAPTPAQPAPTSTPKTSVPAVKTSPGSSVGNLQPKAPPTTQSSPTSGSQSNTSPGTPFQAATETYTSDNWSGYFAVSGGSYTGVSANWVAPAPSASSPNPSADTTWIGIGGILSSDLIQVGTFNTISPSGRLYTQAFYEMLPGSSINVTSLSVSPGDSISASLSEVSSSIWSVTITDNTTDQTFNTTVSYNSHNSSVEWIQEDPSNINGQLLPLDDFGNVPFSVCLAVSGGNALALNQLSANNVTMINNSDQEVGVPSVLGSDGASFSVEWQ